MTDCITLRRRLKCSNPLISVCIRRNRYNPDFVINFLCSFWPRDEFEERLRNSIVVVHLYFTMCQISFLPHHNSVGPSTATIPKLDSANAQRKEASHFLQIIRIIVTWSNANPMLTTTTTKEATTTKTRIVQHHLCASHRQQQTTQKGSGTVLLAGCYATLVVARDAFRFNPTHVYISSLSILSLSLSLSLSLLLLILSLSRARSLFQTHARLLRLINYLRVFR